MNPLEQLAMEYMQFASETKNDQLMSATTKAQIMSQMAQSLNLLVPLLKDDSQQEQQMAVQKHQQELQMAQEKHQLDMYIAQQRTNNN